MKNIFFVLLFAVALMSCEDEERNTNTDTTTEATILGRWVPVGFESNIRYDFTEDKRFAIYGDGSGVFPTLEEFMTENPGLTGNDWEYDGEIVVIDHNFGNYSRLVPIFKCDNQVVAWENESGEAHGTYFREGHDMNQCN